MPQSREELEEWYRSKRDPWDYERNPDDAKRKAIILSHLKGPYEKALDIGCGEGWITKDLPAKIIHGLELSETAKKRLPSPVIPVDEPEDKYDLIVLTGGLYEQYDWRQMIQWILDHASGTVLTSNIKSWEHNILPKEKLVFETEFPYREYIQHLCLYDFSTI